MYQLGITALLTVVLGGCALQPLVGEPPEIMLAETVAAPARELAPPANGQRLNVGIYNCFDSSGQKMETRSGAAGFSTAVLQDCAPYLIAALRELPHYRVLERSRVDDVLKERQLAAVMLGDNSNRALGSLLLADVLMLGQVVSYDKTSSQSVGGISVNAIGIARERVADTFTFNLRAVSTKTGEVLGEVLVKKTVESLQANGHVLRIIGIDTYSLDVGGVVNEPTGLALQQAIILAAQVMTEKGMRAGWWSG